MQGRKFLCAGGPAPFLLEYGACFVVDLGADGDDARIIDAAYQQIVESEQQRAQNHEMQQRLTRPARDINAPGGMFELFDGSGGKY